MYAKRVLWFFALVLLISTLSPMALAQLGSRPAKDWIESLEGSERIAELKIGEVIAEIGLAPGLVVADIGAGTGVFSRPFARAVSPGGQVYAVEVDPELLDYIGERAAENDIENIIPVLGEFEDPKLPASKIDVAFFHDVLHHIEDRPLYLKNLSRSVKSGGRVVIIERIGRHGHGSDMHMTVESVRKWMAKLGFTEEKDVKLYEKNFFLIFRK